MISILLLLLNIAAYDIINSDGGTENIDSSSSVVTTTNDRIDIFSSRQEHVT